MNVTARRLLGAALLRSGDAKGALDVLRPIALRGDADSYTLALVGRAFEATGERDWAANFLDRSAWPAANGAAPFDRAGRRPDGLKVLSLFLSQHPEDVAALRLAAHWQIAARDWDGAIDTLEDLRSRVGSRDAGLLAELTSAN